VAIAPLLARSIDGDRVHFRLEATPHFRRLAKMLAELLLICGVGTSPALEARFPRDAII